jgi:hypothetical protein
MLIHRVFQPDPGACDSLVEELFRLLTDTEAQPKQAGESQRPDDRPSPTCNSVE